MKRDEIYKLIYDRLKIYPEDYMFTKEEMSTFAMGRLQASGLTIDDQVEPCKLNDNTLMVLKLIVGIQDDNKRNAEYLKFEHCLKDQRDKPLVPKKG